MSISVYLCCAIILVKLDYIAVIVVLLHQIIVYFVINLSRVTFNNK